VDFGHYPIGKREGEELVHVRKSFATHHSFDRDAAVLGGFEFVLEVLE